VRLSARGERGALEVARVAEDLVAHVTERFGPIVYGRDEEDLAAVVEDGLRRRGWRLAVAESCTGGLITARLTDIAGSSDVLEGGLVTYSNDAKHRWLGVPEELIERHGAVSAEVAAAMASGARSRCAADVGVAVTGIAGPGGGTPAKPVGLVYAAVDGPDGGATEELRLVGNRAQIRMRTTMRVLDLVRRYLLGRVPAA
jgi:nicotinamide-nucleotide amidase